jgi:hypothetical protein
MANALAEHVATSAMAVSTERTNIFVRGKEQSVIFRQLPFPTNVGNPWTSNRPAQFIRTPQAIGFPSDQTITQDATSSQVTGMETVTDGTLWRLVAVPEKRRGLGAIGQRGVHVLIQKIENAAFAGCDREVRKGAGLCG